jgi:hypothetical protein
MTLSLPKGQHRQPFEQLEGPEQQMRRAIRPGMPEGQQDVALRRAVEPIPGDRRAQRVPTEPFETRSLAGLHPDGGLQVEPVLARGSTRLTAGLTAPGCRGLIGLKGLAALAHARTRTRPQGHRPLHGGRRDRQDAG